MPTNDAIEGPPSVISTEGRNLPKRPKKKSKKSDRKTKRHKTKPTNNKERVKKPKKQLGGETDAKRGGSDRWAPDPNDLNDIEWERALVDFFTKNNKEKLPSVPKMARMYRNKRGP